MGLLDIEAHSLRNICLYPCPHSLVGLFVLWLLNFLSSLKILTLILYQLHSFQIFSWILLVVSSLCWVPPLQCRCVLAWCNLICPLFHLLSCFQSLFPEIPMPKPFKIAAMFSSSSLIVPVHVFRFLVILSWFFVSYKVMVFPHSTHVFPIFPVQFVKDAVLPLGIYFSLFVNY